MRIYFDSSAFIKRYIDEKGSDGVLARCGVAKKVVLSALSYPEIMSFLNKMVRRDRLTPSDYGLFGKVVRSDFHSAEVHAINETILTETVRVLENGPIGSLDSIHIATALYAGCDLFLTADRQQHNMALKLGLKSELAG